MGWSPFLLLGACSASRPRRPTSCIRQLVPREFFSPLNSRRWFSHSPPLRLRLKLLCLAPGGSPLEKNLSVRTKRSALSLRGVARYARSSRSALVLLSVWCCRLSARQKAQNAHTSSARGEKRKGKASHTAVCYKQPAKLTYIALRAPI